MKAFLDFILLFLSQFAGGPGPPENNLVRFGLPAVMWAVLLYVAWARQRTQELPREKLLVWGFGLALVRELYMFGQIAGRLLGSGDVEVACDVSQPIEHGLAMAAMIMVAGAFLRYCLADPRTARRYLLIGLSITLLALGWAAFSWPRQLASNPSLKFHQIWSAWLFHIPLALWMGVAISLLWQKKGWLRNVVVAALGLYLTSELFLLLNYATERAYNRIICPLGNSLHILAIPLLGYVYLREQAIEVKQAEELTRLHEASSYLTSSLNLDQVLEEVSRQSSLLLNCPKACVLRVERAGRELELVAAFGFDAAQLQGFKKLLPGWDLLRELASQPRTTPLQGSMLERLWQDESWERSKPEAVLWVPIWSSENPTEFILLLDETPNRVWGVRELELIEGLATRAAVALVNARLHRQLELSAALEERQRIAANMHDGLAQTLSLLSQQVDKVQLALEDEPHLAAAAGLQEIQEVVALTSAEVRRSIASLQQAPRRRVPLQDLLAELLAPYKTEAGPEIVYQPGSGPAVFIPSEQCDQVLPIVQEAVLNACHHAQAHTITVGLEKREAEMCITIVDDGIGFDAGSPQHNSNHFGLSIMQARAARLQARFQVDSSPGNGTRVSLGWQLG